MMHHFHCHFAVDQIGNRGQSFHRPGSIASPDRVHGIWASVLKAMIMLGGHVTENIVGILFPLGQLSEIETVS